MSSAILFRLAQTHRSWKSSELTWRKDLFSLLLFRDELFQLPDQLSPQSTMLAMDLN